MLGWDGPHNGLVGDVSAVWWRWRADVDLLSGAVNRQGSGDCKSSGEVLCGSVIFF